MVRPDALLVQFTRVVRNAIIDLHFGRPLFFNTHNWRKHGLFDPHNSDYAALSQIFRDRVAPSDVLVDVGCRKGRVINWWLSQGLQNRIIGVELDEDLAEETRRRLSRYSNVTVLTGDILVNIPAEGTIFYLFNPFEESAIRQFKDRLLDTFKSRGNVTVIYLNCIHNHIFEQDPAWNVELHDVNSHPKLPFSPFAIIRLANCPGADGAPISLGSTQSAIQRRQKNENIKRSSDQPCATGSMEGSA